MNQQDVNENGWPCRCCYIDGYLCSVLFLDVFSLIFFSGKRSSQEECHDRHNAKLIGWHCGAGVFGLIGCRSLSPSVALPTFLAVEQPQLIRKEHNNKKQNVSQHSHGYNKDVLKTNIIHPANNNQDCDSQDVQIRM